MEFPLHKKYKESSSELVKQGKLWEKDGNKRVNQPNATVFLTPNKVQLESWGRVVIKPELEPSVHWEANPIWQ